MRSGGPATMATQQSWGETALDARLPAEANRAVTADWSAGERGRTSTASIGTYSKIMPTERVREVHAEGRQVLGQAAAALGYGPREGLVLAVRYDPDRPWRVAQAKVERAS